MRLYDCILQEVILLEYNCLLWHLDLRIICVKQKIKCGMAKICYLFIANLFLIYRENGD